MAAGSAGMEGAAILCTRGAMAAGAGMIRLGSPGDPAAAWPTEAVRMHLPAEGWAGAFLEATAKCRAVVIGPGLGTGGAVAEEIRAVIAAAPVPLVIDADALTALGDAAAARTLLDKRSAPEHPHAPRRRVRPHRRLPARGGPPGGGAPRWPRRRVPSSC